jgi:hypothetical protein
MSKNSSRQNLETLKSWVKFMEYKYPKYKTWKRDLAKKVQKKEQSDYYY